MPPSTDTAPRSAEGLLATLLSELERELPDAVELRRRLHAEPELAHAEGRTAATIESALPVPAEAAAGTGRLAVVGVTNAPPVAVRAELDGLPLRERTGAPFSAGGETMHACGHDVHMAALVALARAAQRIAAELPLPLLAVFQPSEEAYPSGARELAHGALAERAPAAVVAAHVHPELPWGSTALDAGTVNASCDHVEIVVEGEPTHAAYPHRGRDPVLAVSELVVALHARAGRVADPLYPSSLNVGVIEAGSAENLIPAQAHARVAIRAHRSEDRERLRAMVEEVAEGVAAAHGCRVQTRLEDGEPPLENDSAIISGARALLPASGLALAPEWRSVGCDDFSFFSELAPLGMSFVGLRGAPNFAERPLHHPELLVPDEAVGAVARAQAVLYVAASAAATGA